MTEQTPKLDVQTLEYVLSIVEKNKEAYENMYKECVCGDDAKVLLGHWAAMRMFKNEIVNLIKQQEAE